MKQNTQNNFQRIKFGNEIAGIKDMKLCQKIILEKYHLKSTTFPFPATETARFVNKYQNFLTQKCHNGNIHITENNSRLKTATFISYSDTELMTVEATLGSLGTNLIIHVSLIINSTSLGKYTGEGRDIFLSSQIIQVWNTDKPLHQQGLM